MTPHILLVEDDAEIARAVIAALRDAGFAPSLASDGAQGLRDALGEAPISSPWI